MHASPVRTRSWLIAILAVFFLSGLALATWASRMPAIKSTLAIDNAQVGILLFTAGAASLVGLSIAPLVLLRVGAKRGILIGVLVIATGVIVLGVGVEVFGSYALAIAGMIGYGLGASCVDIMMNVEGAAIEQEVGRTLLPVMHAMFSFGTVAGAGAGFLVVRLQISVLVHFVAAASLIAVMAIVATLFIPARSFDNTGPIDRPTLSWRERLARTLSAWREPRTYALGVIMLGMAFAEGGANDWLPLAMVEGHHSTEEAGAAALTAFSISMALVRLIGGPLVDRFGRVVVLRILAFLAAGGLLLFILAPNPVLAFTGIVLWGAGASLGFPLGMSAAADDPAKAAARVAAASTIGYTAFLCGPPILGLISEHIGLLNTLFIIVVLAVASGFAAPAAKPLPGSRTGSSSH